MPLKVSNTHRDVHQKEKWTRAHHRWLGTWIFGSLLFLFIMAVFIFAPATLPEFKHRLLAISAALLAGFFAFFLTGEIGLEVQVPKSRLGDMALRAAGGFGMFALVLIWWLSPLAPVEQSASKPGEAPVMEQALSGSIRDETGDPVVGVTVSLPAFGATDTTDQFGRFHFRVKAPRQATVELMAQAPGYQTHEQYATLGNTSLSFSLKRKQ